MKGFQLIITQELTLHLGAILLMYCEIYTTQDFVCHAANELLSQEKCFLQDRSAVSRKGDHISIDTI